MHHRRCRLQHLSSPSRSASSSPARAHVLKPLPLRQAGRNLRLHRAQVFSIINTILLPSKRMFLRLLLLLLHHRYLDGSDNLLEHLQVLDDVFRLGPMTIAPCIPVSNQIGDEPSPSQAPTHPAERIPSSCTVDRDRIRSGRSTICRLEDNLVLVLNDVNTEGGRLGSAIRS